MRHTDHLELFAERNFINRSIDLTVIVTRSDGVRSVGQPLTMTALDPDKHARIDPTLSLSPEQAQQLMEELWKAGIRPNEVGGIGELQATKAHLQDIRALAFQDPTIIGLKEKPKASESRGL